MAPPCDLHGVLCKPFCFYESRAESSSATGDPACLRKIAFANPSFLHCGPACNKRLFDSCRSARARETLPRALTRRQWLCRRLLSPLLQVAPTRIRVRSLARLPPQNQSALMRPDAPRGPRSLRSGTRVSMHFGVFAAQGRQAKQKNRSAGSSRHIRRHLKR